MTANEIKECIKYALWLWLGVRLIYDITRALIAGLLNYFTEK